MSTMPSPNATPQPGLPPEAHPWLAAHPDADPNSLEETWRLVHYAQPPEATFEPDPARIATMRAYLETLDSAAKPAPPQRAPLRLIRTRPQYWAIAATVAVLLAVGAVLWLRPTTLQAPLGETLTTALPDGSTVELNSGAKLLYTRLFNANTRTVQLTGEAFFTVAKNPNKPFIVETFNAAVTVLGTRFNVRAWPDETTRTTTVVLEEGSVRVATPSMPTSATVLEPGQISHVTGSNTPSPPRPIAVDQALSWRHGGFFFDDHPVAVILAEVERRFDLTIQAPEALGQQRLALYLARPANADPVLEALCGFLHCRYRATPEGYALLPLNTD